MCIYFAPETQIVTVLHKRFLFPPSVLSTLEGRRQFGKKASAVVEVVEVGGGGVEGWRGGGQSGGGSSDLQIIYLRLASA